MSTARAIPLIEDVFALKIAHEYVRLYRKDGYEAATEYLYRVTGGDEDLRGVIVPTIVKLGEQK